MERGIVLQVHKDYMIVIDNKRDIVKAKKIKDADVGHEVYYKAYYKRSVLQKIRSFTFKIFKK